MAMDNGHSLGVYGPSPSIFGAKWVEKFVFPLRKKRLDPPQDPTKNPFQIIDTCEQSFSLVVNFYAQAAELHLTASDFSDDGEDNPFKHAAKAQNIVMLFLEDCRDIKHGKDPLRQWQVLPLEVRKRINELLVRVEKAEEDGWWVVTDGS